jgi:hypothetical protein
MQVKVVKGELESLKKELELAQLQLGQREAQL